MKQKIEKWQRWFDIIYNDILTVATYRQVFFELREMVEANAHLRRESLYYTFVSDTYSTYCLAAMRRQVDLDSDAVSLYRLLKDLRENPAVLTRKWYVTAFLENANKQRDDPTWTRHANSAFNTFAGSGGAVLIVSSLVTDVEVLVAAVAACKAYVDRRIAHRDHRDPESIPTLSDVHGAIETVGNLVKKYHLLFRFSTLHDFTPIMPLGWKEIFRIPWLPV
jgi:hypothetical protein